MGSLEWLSIELVEGGGVVDNQVVGAVDTPGTFGKG